MTTVIVLQDYVLVMEMFNYQWDIIKLWLPLYDDLDQCLWWSEYFSKMFRNHHDAIVYVNKCQPL